MNKNMNRNSDDWTCDICGQEVENLYFIDNNTNVCDSCRENIRKKPSAEKDK